MGEKNKVDKKAAAAAAGGGGGKKDDGAVAIVLKVDFHCEGCAKKVKRSIQHFDGVEDVTVDYDSGKLTVKGNVDPTWLKERVEHKTKKKVDLLSPQPKKGGGGGGNEAGSGGDGRDKKKVEQTNEKKPKTPQVKTVILKIRLHCEGCINKIRRTILKNDGVDEVSVDAQKDLITVKGTMDIKDLVAYLQEKIKRSVEVVPPKKDAGGSEKKEKQGGGDKKEKEGGGDKKDGKTKAASGDGEANKSGGQANKMEYQGYNNPDTYFATPMYNQQYANQDYGLSVYNHGYRQTNYGMQYSHAPPPPPPHAYLQAPQMFSDENPNACSVM